MKCPACKSDNLGSTSFCNHCGISMAALETCAACGKSNPPGSKFCNQCGQPLAAPRSEHPRQGSHFLAYTPKFLADKVLTRRSSVEGEHKRVTVLFADVAGFTAMSEKLDPEQMHEIMDGCFTILMDHVHKYEGTINQFTGDGVMALFGAPLAQEDHAQRACYASLDIQNALLNYSAKIQQRIGLAFQMRIGLNSGPVVVGAIGDDLRMDYTAIGDTTNLSARMEGLAEPGTIRVSENTYRLARDYFQFKARGTTVVKGKTDPQETFELMGAGRMTSRLAAAAQHGLTAYAGRRKELANLVSALKSARSGHGQIVGISGEPGVGKSRLVYELRHAFDGQIAHFEGRCMQFGQSIAFLPFKDIIRDFFDVGEGDSPESISDKISRHIDSLGLANDKPLAACQDLLGVPVVSESWQHLLPKERKMHAFRVLRDLLLQASRKNPLVLVVEDLHWIDKTSEEFLEFMARKVEKAAILMLLLFRPEYGHTWADHPSYHDIPLIQLSEDTGTRLVESILGNTAIVPALIRFILDRSGGNPLFIEELTRTLAENGAISWKSDRYVLDERMAAAKVPENIHGIIAARIDRLEDEVKRVVQVAAVIGRDFALRVLQATTRLRAELTDYLECLQNLGFIYQKHRYPEVAYIFKHALTQEVAYNSLLHQKRAYYHAHVAVAVEQLYTDRIEDVYEVLAHHYHKSGQAENAYRYLRLSGEKAVRTHFLWEAYDYYKKALFALDRLPEHEENQGRKLEVLKLMIIPIIGLGMPEGSIFYLEQGIHISEELGKPRSTIRFYSNSGIYYTNRGQVNKGLACTKTAFENAETIDDVAAMAQAGPDLMMVYMNSGRYPKTICIATRITAAIEKAGRESDYFGGLTNIYSVLKAFSGYSKGMLGQFEEGLADCETALISARLYGGAETIGTCEGQLGVVHLLKGNFDRARDILSQSVRHMEQANFYWHLSLCRSMLGLAETFLGHPRSGLVHVVQSIEECRRTGIEWRRSGQYFALGVCHYYLGDYQQAKKVMQTAHDESVSSGEKHVTGKVLIWLGRIEAQIDPKAQETALALIGGGINMLQRLETRPDLAIGYLFLGKLYHRFGVRGRAFEHIRRSTNMLRDLGMNIDRRLK